jgi:hypothetical protein
MEYTSMGNNSLYTNGFCSKQVAIKGITLLEKIVTKTIEAKKESGIDLIL